MPNLSSKIVSTCFKVEIWPMQKQVQMFSPNNLGKLNSVLSYTSSVLLLRLLDQFSMDPRPQWLPFVFQLNVYSIDSRFSSVYQWCTLVSSAEVIWVKSSELRFINYSSKCLFNSQHSENQKWRNYNHIYYLRQNT